MEHDETAQVFAADNSLSSSIIMLFPRLLSLYRQNIDKMVQPFDISAGQTPLLYLLSQKEGRNQAELAKVLGVRPSSLTSMLNRMEHAGLLERRASDTDQRAYNIYLTDKGRRISKKLSAITRFINERTLAGFRGEEKLLLLRLLEHMMSNMRRQSAELSLTNPDELPGE